MEEYKIIKFEPCFENNVYLTKKELCLIQSCIGITISQISTQETIKHLKEIAKKIELLK